MELCILSVLETHKFGNINCVTVKTGDTTEDGKSTQMPNWNTFVSRTCTEHCNRERLTRDMNLFANLRVATLKAGEQKRSKMKAILSQKDTEMIDVAMTPAQQTETETLVTPVTATTSQVLAPPPVASPAAVVVAATALPTLPLINTAEHCLDFVKGVGKEARETKE